VRRSAPLDPETRDSRATPARRTELQDLRGTLEQALAQLTPIQREVVLLHDLHDWPHENIAESIGTTPGMSRQHLFKARRRLRETLGPHLLHEYFND
jgi:RNA polymerase sigma-70 factor (ECF subfamily)